MEAFIKQKLLLSLILCGVMLVTSSVSAVGISVGYPNPIPLLVGENLYYGASSGNSGNLMLLKVNNIEKFSINPEGDISIYGDLKPGGINCTSGQILQKQGVSGWVCASLPTGTDLSTWATFPATANVNLGSFQVGNTANNNYISFASTYLNIHPATDSYGIVLRDKDLSTYYLGLTQVDGASYLADSNTALTNYFIKGDGRDVTVGNNLYVNAVYGRSGTAESIWLGDTNDTIQVQGSLNMNSKTITNLATPVASTDAASKGYVDTAVSGITPNLNGWTFTDNYFYDDNEQIIGAYDEWLRLNNASDFTNGVYTPGLLRADGGIQVDTQTAISSDNYWHEAKSNVSTRYGYFNVRNSLGTRGAYFGWGDGNAAVDLVLDNASLLNITGGNVAISDNLTVGGKNVCLADGTNCLTSTGDNLGNHTATTNLNVADWQIQNINELEMKDFDDNTGGADNKYRVLGRDGAWMFHDGGVVVGSYSNGTWTDLADGQLIVEGSVGIGITNPGTYKLNVVGDANVSGNLNAGTISSGSITSSGTFFGTNANLSGNVAAGTISVGSISATGNITAAGNITSPFWNSNVDAQIRMDADNNGTNYFKINNGANSTVFRVEENGNVGVNYTGTGNANMDLNKATIGLDDGYPISWGNESIYGYGTGITLSAGGGANYITIKDTGNVGIGITAPTAKLDVAGDIKTSGTLKLDLVTKTCNPGTTSATCTCDAGYVILTGGGECYDNLTPVMFENYPLSDFRSWKVSCYVGDKAYVRLTCVKMGDI